MTDRLSYRRFYRGGLTMVSRSAAGRALLLLAAPLLTRIYGPAAFGEFQLYFVAVGLLLPVATLRYEFAIPLPRSRRAAAAAVRLALGLVGVVSVGLFILAGFIEANGWIRSGSFDYIAYVPFGVAIAGAIQVLTFVSIRDQDMTPLAASRFLQPAVTAGTQLVLPTFGAGAVGLVLGDLFGRFAAFLRLLFAHWALLPILRRSSWAEARRVAGEYVRFAVFSAPSAFLVAASRFAPVMILAMEFGAATAGLYALADRLVGLPSQLLGRDLANVFYSEASVLAKGDRQGLLRFAIQVSTRLATVISIPLVAVGLLSPFVVGFIFGAEWNLAGSLAAWLSISYAVRLPVVPVSDVLFILGKQLWHMAWAAGRLAISIGSMVLVIGRSGDPTAAVAGYSLATAAAFAILYLISLKAIRSGDVADDTIVQGP